MTESRLRGLRWNGDTFVSAGDLAIKEILDVTTLLLERNVGRGLGDVVALREVRGPAVTYAELLGFVNDLSARLPWQTGGRVVVQLGDSVAFGVCFLALLRAGLVAVPVSSSTTGERLREIVDDSGAVAVLTSLPPAFTEGCGAEVVRLGAAGALIERLAPLLGRAPERAPRRPHRGDDGFWLYSSGTSGTPKACRHRHQDIAVASILYGRNVLAMRVGERCVSMSPLDHSYGLGVGLYLPLWAGAEVLLPGTTHPAALWRLLVAERVRRLFGVPRHYAQLVDAARTDAELTAGHALAAAHSSGERLPDQVADGFAAATGIAPLDAMSASEMFPNVVSNTGTDHRPGSSGRVLPGVAHRLVSAGRIVDGPGTGELEIASAANAAGYWNRPDATAAAFVGDYYRTGDVFDRDADGFLYHRGRLSSTFKVFGSFVEPTRVESALRSVAGVNDAVAFEARDQRGVSLCAAAVVLRPGADETGLRAAARSVCADTVAPYAAPELVYVVDALPQTPSGKLRRAGVAEYAATTGRLL